jgi:hypothetical protein
MTMPTDTPRAALLGELAALNRNLARLGASPLVDAEGAEALTDGQLADAVRLTGEHLLTLGRALGGLG